MTDTSSPVPGVTLKATKANNIDMRYAEIGSGPLVLFCHGWPESWYSWRHQLTAVSAAGFRCVAPDMRGYGGTQAPEPIDQYTLHHLVGDMAELVKALSETKAIIVGHDWGAPVAWHAALWRPDLFPAVCAMSVPYAPPGYVDVLTALEKLGINDFYLQYFQKPGVPEAELQQDIRGALRRIYFTAAGDFTDKGKGFARLGSGTLLTNTVDPPTLPSISRFAPEPMEVSVTLMSRAVYASAPPCWMVGVIFANLRALLVKPLPFDDTSNRHAALPPERNTVVAPVFGSSLMMLPAAPICMMRFVLPVPAASVWMTNVLPAH